MRMLRWVLAVPGFRPLFRGFYSVNDNSLSRNIFGIEFPNPVGLAAGFDKDARMIDDLSCLGFGFIEIGTITPKPQPGNEKPRLFRLKSDGAVINRMGFNNDGVEIAIQSLKKRRSRVIVGGNIGKNKVTPNDQALSDYLVCLDQLYDYVDYFVVNVSSPNTPNLRELQEKEPLTRLLTGLKDHLKTKMQEKPLLLKIAPDLTEGQIDDIVEITRSTAIHGLIATNTTISRDNLNTETNVIQNIGAGGLSGRPLRELSTSVIRRLRNALGPDVPIIGVGGIFTGKDALEKLNAGADLVQVYTGFVYEGPSIVKKINRYLLNNPQTRRQEEVKA